MPRKHIIDINHGYLWAYCVSQKSCHKLPGCDWGRVDVKELDVLVAGILGVKLLQGSIIVR